MIIRPLVLLGTGRIARALLRQLLDRTGYLHDRYDLSFPVAALSTSRYLIAGSPYLAPELVNAVANGEEPAVSEQQARSGDDIAALVRTLSEKAIVVDLTAADGTASVLIAALDAGADIVLANKKPLCEDYATFVQLTAHRQGRIGYEATVGAGLPIVQTLRTLFDAGDTLSEATACLSGTLGFVCSELEDGRPLSSIVPEALERGFTEPDPRDDLSGTDVQRKALILARTMGLRLNLADIPATPLIPLDTAPDVGEWLAGLGRYDVGLAQRVRRADEQGDVLRYVARLWPDGCEVGLHEVPRGSAVGRLRGTDNIITIYTRYYNERPLVIAGPGAGPDVTAAGVFGDIIRLSGVL